MLEIVAGPPFAGKSQYVDREIARREADGEAGIIVIDFTRLYQSMFPGEADAVRTAGSVGVPLAAYVREAVLRQALQRELDGYLTVAQPAKAEELRTRLDAREITVIDTQEPDVRKRMETHLKRMYAIKSNVDRKAAIRGECEKAVAGWFASYVEQEWHRRITTGSYRR